MSQQSAVTACFHSCIGGLVAMAGNDGNVVLWHGMKCQVVNSIQSPYKNIQGVCLSSDGNLLACAFKDRVIVWDVSVSGGCILQQLSTDSINVTNISFSYNTCSLLGYSVGGGIIVWNWRNRQVLFQLQRGMLLKNAFLSNDGKSMFVCTQDAKVATIDLNTRNICGGINLCEVVQKTQVSSLQKEPTMTSSVAEEIPGAPSIVTQPHGLTQDLVDILHQKNIGGSGDSSPKESQPQSSWDEEGPNSFRQVQDPVQLNFNSLPSTQQRSAWCLADFDIIKKVYKGKNSTILHAIDRVSGMHVAIKSYDVSQLSLIEQTQVAREVKLHANLTHPNVIRLYAAWLEGNNLNLVMDYANGGDLYMFQRNCKKGVLTDDIAVPLVLEPLISSLKELHANGIIHRDLKPENVLFDDTFQIKLCDFGLAINSRQETPNTRLGTIDYVAPEILQCPIKVHPFQYKGSTHQLSYSSKVDVWALGILVYELLVGRPPFAGNSDAVTLTNIRVKEVHVPDHITPLARDFILLCLNKNPQSRPSIDSLYNHPWLQQYRAVQVPSSVLASIACINTNPATIPTGDFSYLGKSLLFSQNVQHDTNNSQRNPKNLLKIPGVTTL
eukprot:TRINITY_DN68_c0_g1_i1.p1 TRINITY_DN68_c0_g1~~TRINITY_DN68_c0_g1_i1.p1  ORF type:complete len:610 (-),score=23.29 TRINITY_DN68_c0_g1_i1:514-2343(-)